MFRKAVNMVPRDDMDDLKFFSWQCLTLKLKTQLHTVDLIIPDQKNMLRLLTLLVFKLKIFNGDTGTAKKILDLMNRSHT